jgi:alpha-tubulin suppressor-like RCC1 family protein
MRTPTIFLAVLSLAALTPALCAGCGDDGGGGTEPQCGDNSLDQGEACDGPQLGGETCLSLGYHGGQLVCASDCQFDISSCEVFGRCGDGTVQQAAGEECDGQSPDNLRCEDLNYFGGSSTCTESCTLDTAGCNGLVQIDVGGHSTCALDQAGQVWCWGLNSIGQLGNGGGTQTCTLDNDPVDCARTPVRATGMSSVVAIAVGDMWGAHACAVKTDGTVWCWGSNHMGQLGIGIRGGHRDEPQQVSGPASVVAVAVGGPHSCALQNDGTVWCWGHNDYFQLGDGQTHDTCNWAGRSHDCSATPVQANTPPEVTAIVAGRSNTCVLIPDGTLWCWGGAWAGQLGNNGTYEICLNDPVHAECERDPVQPVGMDDVTIVGPGGGLHQCAGEADGTLWCWGADFSGQIGDGAAQQICTTQDYPDFACQPVPVQVTDLTGPLAVTGGEEYTCAIAADQTPWCWGFNSQGQLGLGGTGGAFDVPQQVSELSGVLDIAAGDSHTCAVATDNTAWCWGRNLVGELGNPSVTETKVGAPVPVLPP